MHLRSLARIGTIHFLALAALVSVAPNGSGMAQGVDCGRLQQQIAAAGNGNHLAAAASRQRAELARTTAYAHQLGCDRQQFSFFGSSAPPQCDGLNARIGQMQANLSQLQAGAGGGGRDELVARFNAYCRSGAPAPRQRGFFESLFGGGEEPRQAPPAEMTPGPAVPGEADGEGIEAHGGSQAVCVRTCDGGFFPMGMSSHHSADSLREMCSALCPGTEVAVYSRNPNAEIKTAVSLDGTPYADLPNALKFQKTFDAACTCRPAGKSWAETLANAESVLGGQRKGDILVTPEKAEEMSRPKLDGKTRAGLLKGTDTASASAAAANNAGTADAAQVEVTGPDGVTRHVRKVGPQL